MKKLIVNADDFGFTTGVNAGILHAFRSGIVTSATLLANGEAFDDAVQIASANPGLGVGCHLTILASRPVAATPDVPSLVDRRGLMPASLPELISKVLRGAIRIGDMEREFDAQIERIRNAGIQPTHLDMHKHAHMCPPVLEAMARASRRWGIGLVRKPFEMFHWPKTTAPIRRRPAIYARQYTVSLSIKPLELFFRRIAERYGLRSPDYLCGLSLTGLLDRSSITSMMESMRDGTTELMCHPGFYDEQLQSCRTRLKQEREREVEALTDSEVLRCLRVQGITLICYRALA